MEIIKTGIQEVVILKPLLFGDERGHFFESFSQREFIEKVCRTVFVQDNESYSIQGVVRGLHYQLPPHAQSKLVRVARGCILDVAVDIRAGSPTFGRHVCVELSDENRLQLFVPRGFAHGFSVLSREAVVQYKCDNYYHRESEGSIIYDDADLGIDWKIPVAERILSEKDSLSPAFNQAKLFDYKDILY